MKKIETEELKRIKGGANFAITGVLLSEFNNLIQILMNAGQQLGSSLRRIGSDKICPIK